MRRSAGKGELAGSSINHPRKRKEKKGGKKTVDRISRRDRPGRFFRLKGQVELQPIRQVGTHKASTRTRRGENGSKREKAREQGKRDIQGTRIRMTSFIDQSCLSHTLRLVCKTNYQKDSLASRRIVQNVLSIFIHARDTIEPCSWRKITPYCPLNPSYPRNLLCSRESDF